MEFEQDQFLSNQRIGAQNLKIRMPPINFPPGLDNERELNIDDNSSQEFERDDN